MITALVTGTGGFVGSHVLEAILALTDWNVVAIDSFTHNGRFDRTLDAMRGHDARRVTRLVHDLTVPVRPTQLESLRSVDYVINVASRSHVGQSISEPVTFIENNVKLILNVLELARYVRPSRFVQMSTDEVYGPYDDVRSTTDHRPSSPYAASKAAQEDICHAYTRTYDVPMTVINSANMFGERQSTLAFIPRIVAAALSNDRLFIHTVGGVPGRRAYTYVRNVSHRVVELLSGSMIDVERQTDYVQRLVLPGQQTLDNQSLATTVAGLLDRPIQLVNVSGESVRPGYDDYYHQTWSRNDWSERGVIGFDEGLRQTVTWYADNADMWLEYAWIDDWTSRA